MKISDYEENISIGRLNRKKPPPELVETVKNLKRIKQCACGGPNEVLGRCKKCHQDWIDRSSKLGAALIKYLERLSHG